jgi:hypothetical protein
MNHTILNRLQTSKGRSIRLVGLLAALALLAPQTLDADENVAEQPAGLPQINPRSPSGLDFYSQGGVVVDGVGYFTANDYSRRAGVKRTDEFPCVVAFDMHTFKKVREYKFGFTYDSSPLVYQKQDGTWLVIAHEHKNARTVAMNRDTGKVEWISEADQPGTYFFGYSYYQRDDGTKLLLMACQNGLHAMSGETGKDVWWVKRPSTGGITPCVDQKRGVLYYQCNAKVLKIRAADGEVLREVDAGTPHVCISWNTVLIDDKHGRFVATRWYGKPEWDSAIRVYDEELNLAWERTGLPNGKKDTLTYAEGKLVCGSGNGWSKKYTGNEWKHISAYNIADGEIAWKCDLSEYDYIGILNVPYFNGSFYAENGGSPPQTTKCFRINAADGRLEEVYDYGRMITSCATHIVAHGKLLSGDLWQDSIVVTNLSDNSTADWPGPFGDPQTNQMAAPHEAGVTLTTIQEVSVQHEPAVGEDRANLARDAAIKARSRIKGEQADVNRMVDGNPQTRWASGPGDLALAPVDVDVQLKKPQVVDTVVVLTSTLKGQLRLKDFDLYAGLGDRWDGAKPLARIRDNTVERIRVTFPAVQLDRIRIRPLGTRRPDNAFAHIAELNVYAADGPSERSVESSPFPPTLADAGHDPKFLRTLIASLESKVGDSALARVRTKSLHTRLELIKESQQYEAVLEQISTETEEYQKLDAPEWAVAQRDCMARLRTWAHYWIDHQQPDGQFGGSYEDDVELVCGWPVLVLAQDDEKVRRALELLAEGVWKSRPFLERFGYDRLTDVEHAAENTSYSQPRMVVLDYDNPKWSERCSRTAATMHEHFLSRNEKGGLQFRSDYFGFDPRTLKPVTREQERPFDIPESAKALKPAMYAVWATDDPLARQLMLECGNTWVEAARAGGDDTGRIAGLLPEQLSWPSGASVGTHARLSSMRATLFHLIGCYYVSGEDRYLEPIRTLLQKSLVDWSVKDVPSAGTLDKLQEEDLTGLLEQLALIAVAYRRATGDRQFDAALARWSARIRNTLVDGVKSYVYLNRNSDRLWYVDRPLTIGAYLESRCSVGAQLYQGWQVTGDDDYLAKLGWNLSSCLNDKWGAFTYWFYDKSERRVTSNDHPAHKIQCSESALSLMYLGGPAPVEAVWPQFAVSWENVGTNFCALVRHNDSERLLVEMYSFDEQLRPVTANLWELAPGNYEAALGSQLTQNSHVNEPTWSKSLNIASRQDRRRPTTLQFTLPPRKRTILEIRRR